VISTFKTILALSACVCATVVVFHERLQAHSLTFAAAGAMQKSSQGTGDSATTAHVPPMGSPERKAIMDALRGDQKVIFKVNYLKVHGDWAWTDVTPLDDKGKPVAEGGPSLMHKENGKWKVMDLSAIPQDPDQPLEAEDTPPEFVKKLQSIFPGVPADIFPRHPRAK
jgi:hypothetical protein